MSRTVITNRTERETVVVAQDRKTVVYGKAAPGPIGPAGAVPIAMSIRGTLVVGFGVIPYPLVEDRTVLRVLAAVGQIPTGAAVIIDVNKNGTSIMGPAKLRIEAGQALSAETVPADTVLTAGDVLTVDVDQIGSIIPGANATIVIEVV